MAKNIDEYQNYKVCLSKAENAQLTLLFWYIIEFTEIRGKLFKWNLPKNINIDIMERNLFNEGRVLFFDTETDGYLALPCSAFSRFNEQGEPIEYQAIGFTGKVWRRNLTNAVLIKNLPMLSPCLPRVFEECKLLVDIRQATVTNVNSVKTPFVFTGNKDQLLTLKNIFKKISNNEPVTYIESGMLQNLQVLNTQAPFVADKLDTLYYSTLGKILTYIGINNNQVEKKERLTNDEINSNNDWVNAHLMTALRCRQEACDRINELFPDVQASCELNTEYIETGLLSDIESLIGGEENGNTTTD